MKISISMLIFLLLFFSVWTIKCSSDLPVKDSVKAEFNPEYLVLNEKLLLDFYGTPEEKSSAISTLTLRCNSSIADAHACYNLAAQYLTGKNYKDGYKLAERAVELKPQDPLYSELFRRYAIESNQVETIKTKYPVTGETAYLYSVLEDSCRKGNEADAISALEKLIEKNATSSDTINSGFIKECISTDQISALSKKAAGNKISYSNYYYQEKSKSNVFNKVWDTESFTKNKSLEDEGSLKSELTAHWRDFKKSVSSNNKPDAKKHLKNFLQTLSEEEKNSQKDKHLYTALRRAAFLLIEQDEFFKNFRNLTEEF